MGKSRLLWEAVHAADTTSTLATAVAATPATARIPFGALASLLPATLPDAASPSNLLRFAAEALTKPAGRRRLVLGVDDAHVLDETSAGLLHQLAQSGQAFVLASIRSGEPAPEPITGLWKDELVERVEVRALTSAEVEHVLGQVLDGQIASATVQRLWETTRGNMLFLRELVNAGLDSGALAKLEGVWHWTGEWVMAPRLQELLAARFGRLEADEHRLLELVAHGEPLTGEVVSRLAEVRTLHSVEEKGLLSIRQSDRPGREEIQLAHPLYGEVLRAQCPSLRARSWKRMLADSLETDDNKRDDDWLRIATWRLDADISTSADLLMKAGRQAWRTFDLPLTERLAQAAIAEGAGVEAVKLLWRALSLAERTEQTEALIAHWMLAPMPEQDRKDLVLGRAINLCWGLDQTDRALELLREAEAATSNQAVRDEYSGLSAVLLAHAERSIEGVELAESLLAREPSTPYAEALARTAQCLALTCISRLDDPGIFLEAREFVKPWDNEMPFLGMMIDTTSVWALLFAGRLDLAGQLADYITAQAEDHGPALSAYFARAARAHVARYNGKPETARRILREGLGVYRQQSFGWYVGPGYLLGELAHAEALLGNSAVAAATLREADESARSSTGVLQFWPELARPWVSVAAGDRVGAIESAFRLADHCRESKAVGVEMAALHDVVRLGYASRVVDRLTDIRGAFRGWMLKYVVAHAEAAARDNGDELDEAAAGFEKIGADLLAAEAYAQASQAHQNAGKPASARESRARSALLLDRCEGARTPAVEAVSSPDLTPRERDIAKLAAEGMSNKAIAERLQVSKRTVDNHLHQAYAKLGISRRAELGTWFGKE
ncbi:LuxR family transcriptional regulator [Flindersiella endophytica]